MRQTGRNQRNRATKRHVRTNSEDCDGAGFARIPQLKRMEGPFIEPQALFLISRLPKRPP